MAFRRIPLDKRVEAIKGCIKIENVKEMSIKYEISEATIISDCCDLLNETEEMLKKRSLVGKLKILLTKAFLVLRCLWVLTKRKLHRLKKNRKAVRNAVLKK